MNRTTLTLAALVLLSCCSGESRAGFLTLDQSHLLQLDTIYDNPSGEGTTTASKTPSDNGVLFDGTLGTLPGTQFYPFAQIGIGADSLTLLGTRNLTGFGGFALDFTNEGNSPVFVGIFVTTGPSFQFYQSGFVVLPPGNSSPVVLDFLAEGVQNLDQVQQIGLQIGANVGSNNISSYQVLASPVPEPTSLTLLGLGSLGLLGYGRRQRNRKEIMP